jgi:hypothetical protein
VGCIVDWKFAFHHLRRPGIADCCVLLVSGLFRFSCNTTGIGFYGPNRLQELPRSLRAVSEAPKSEKAAVLMCGGAFRYSDLKEAAFVRGGRYGISIDFGLQVVGNNSTCSMLKSKLIDTNMKPGSMIAFIVTQGTTFFRAPTPLFSRISRCRWLHARDSVCREAASFKQTSGPGWRDSTRLHGCAGLAGSTLLGPVQPESLAIPRGISVRLHHPSYTGEPTSETDEAIRLLISPAPGPTSKPFSAGIQTCRS